MNGDVLSDVLRAIRAVATVATAVGYDSEAAFSRSFKRIVGVPPGEWRRTRTAGAAAAARA